MNNRKEFFDLLEKTIVRDSLPLQEQIKLYEMIDQKVKEFIPKSFFRFRSFTMQNLSAFNNDELWFSSPDSMNDGFDARLFVTQEDKEIVKERIVSEIRALNKTTFLKLYEAIKFPSLKNSTILQEVEKQPEDFEPMKSQLLESMNYFFESLYSCIPDMIQNRNRICCFSESINSSSMWGLYGDGETGFCLEYTFDKQPFLDDSDCRCFLLPVCYTDKRYCLNQEYLQYLAKSICLNYFAILTGFFEKTGGQLFHLVCPDLFLALKTIIRKATDWSNEKEWRLIILTTTQGPRSLHFNKRATGVYLGRRIDPFNAKILTLLAKEKHIPIYKMRINDESPSFGLEYEPIQ